MGYLRQREAWKDRQTIVMLRCERRVGRQRSRQTRYYISSLPNDAQRILKTVRGHWYFENGLHWVLDTAFQKDQSRLCTGHGPHNFVLLRHIGLNPLKQEKTEKIGIKAKRLRATVDQTCLLKVLAS
ncbi:MAG: ISAs1 family transposase [Anaerolineae bacterium]|nr:ISAs1 family transposase [Anaerolineae bacterium]